ncbi:FAD-binding protein [Thalassospira sp. MCCC 1A01428]|uniref:FAD-binding protein n=1 Tax=Thalassospira sp. MCCC 1A01428 TaxID=1470575 RepID=UPI000A1E1DFA|nr:FAD-binding protein [Thalassospira sp. MCCC 1A01428]OSQ46296.1 glycolate oxidase [Thalassospira sp. MCCC 1A01428]
MAETIIPTSPAQLRDAILWALGDKVALEIIGHGSKRAYGHAVRADYVLDLSKLTGILFYQPEELVISAYAGTPLAEITALLAQKHQQFQFEPGDFPRLLGGQRDGAVAGQAPAGTLGGMVATNISGPRRLKSGAARDHVLGFGAVSGRGEDFKSGGRVMKNVTGFDLSKLMAGSFGTLGVMHTLTLKAMPVPEKTRTVLVPCEDVVLAGQAMTAAMGSENEVSGAAWVPASMLAMISPDAAETGDVGSATSMVMLRIEGPEQSVDWRAAALCRLLDDIGSAMVLRTEKSLSVWQAIADVKPMQSRHDCILWRLSVPSSSGGAVVQALGRIEPNVDAMLDWAGGLVWAQFAAGSVEQAGKIRQIAVDAGGQACLVRAADDLRREIPVFQPLSSEINRINRKISENFDPHNILNPGRMTPGLAQGGVSGNQAVGA